MYKHCPKLVFLPLLITLPLSAAAIDKARMFGKNQPFGITDLPTDNHLRQQLEALPETTRKQALQHLHKFTFPENDTEHLKISPNGHIFYSDPPPARAIPKRPLLLNAAPKALPALPAINVFKLHSRPSSKNRVFLDFDGMTITGSEWNIEAGRATLSAKPYDLDGNPSTFNSEERAAIHEIWHRISEDYAPFNIDVTTALPEAFDLTTGRILFTQDRDANGAYMPADGAGGVAFTDVWKDPEYLSAYSPALVYYNNLGDSETNSMAEAGAHEFGHNLGLAHDGTFSSGYFEGMGNGFIAWAPIMGVSYYDQVTQWSKGEYFSANNKEDDIAIITGQLGIRADDHSNTINNASQLIIDSDGKISVSTPESDPGNTEAVNKGIIETRTDSDVFFFDTQGGTANLLIEPAWTAFYRNDNRGANLDIKASLYNSNRELLATDDPSNETHANIKTALAAGRYYLAIEGVGNSITPYSDYGSLGEFYISGTLADSDNEPPNPNPMTWAQPPSLLSETSITMTASTATDKISTVQYQFVCTYGGTGCVTSSWQNSPVYIAQNIGKGSYRFAVKARDVAGNETARSKEVTVDPIAPTVGDDHANFAEDSAIVVKVLDNDSDSSGGKLSIISFTQGAHGKVSRKSGGLRYKPNKNFSGDDVFAYSVANKRGGVASANVTLKVTPVNDPPIAVKDTVTVKIGGQIDIKPLSNDTDIEGDALSINAVTPAKKGNAVNNRSSISYQAGQTKGIDKLTYFLTDGHGGSAKAVITVNIKKAQ